MGELCESDSAFAGSPDADPAGRSATSGKASQRANTTGERIPDRSRDDGLIEIECRCQLSRFTDNALLHEFGARDLTAKDGTVSSLSPSEEPGALEVVIPLDYKGKVLRLWRFRVRPNYDTLVAGDRRP